MSRLDFASDRPASDVLAPQAQRALTEWRAAFDDRLEALEAALVDPARAGELSALMIEFARVAGDEAEATARQATLDAQSGVQVQTQQAVERARQEFERTGATQLDAVRQSLTESERVNGELRQALEGTRRTQDDLRRQADEARKAAQAAEAEARHADEEHRELLGVQAQLTRQLEEARKAAAAATDRVSTLEEQLAESTREGEANTRDLQAFRRRLEQAVRDAEERSRQQDAERARLEQIASEATARATAAAADADRERGQAQRTARELEALRRQLAATLERVARLEQDLQAKDSTLSELKVELASAQAARAAALSAVARSTAATPASAMPVPVVLPPATAAAAVAAAPAIEPSTAAPTPTPSPTSASTSTPAPTPVPAPTTAMSPVAQVSAPSAPAIAAAPAPSTPETPVLSPALQWLQSLQAPGGGADTAGDSMTAAAPGDEFAGSFDDGGDRPGADHEFDDLLDGEADEPADADDSTGVFSTVADALRAWTSEPSDTSVTGTSAGPAAASETASSPTADASRPLVAPSQFDLVRKSPRIDLSGRRIGVLIDDVPGDLVDLSEQGAQVVTSGMLKPSSHVRVVFPSGGPLANAKAKIAWSRLEPPTHGGGELQYRAGLTFTKIDAKTIDRVLNAPDAPARPVARPRR